MRLLLIAPMGMLIALFVFWLMQWMINPTHEKHERSDDVAMVDFIRSLHDSSSDKKNRDTKEPEKPKPPPSLEAPEAQKSSKQPQSMALPNIQSSLASFKGNGLGGMLSGYGFGDSDVIPLVQVEPRYPAQAISRKIEGYVMVRLKISKLGSVEEVDVIDSNPKGIFEREAIRAAWRYRFKPKLVDGKPVEQMATLPFEFNLEK